MNDERDHLKDIEIIPIMIFYCPICLLQMTETPQVQQTYHGGYHASEEERIVRRPRETLINDNGIAIDGELWLTRLNSCLWMGRPQNLFIEIEKQVPWPFVMP